MIAQYPCQAIANDDGGRLIDNDAVAGDAYDMADAMIGARGRAVVGLDDTAMSKDAERYLWLRDVATWQQCVKLLKETMPQDASGAIDAEMARQDYLRRSQWRR